MSDALVEHKPTSTKKTNRTRRQEIANVKGGVGKTTTVFNLAAEYASRGYRVLAVDTDYSHNLTSIVGLTPAELPTTLNQLLLSPNTTPTREAVIETLLGFDFLPSHPELKFTEAYLLTKQDQTVLRRKLHEVDGDYDFVVLDTPGAQSFMVSQVHGYADEVIIPVETDQTALDGAVKTLEDIKTVRTSGLNPNLTLRGVMVTKYQQRTTVGQKLLKGLMEDYGRFFIPMVVRDRADHRKAHAQRLPVVRYAPKSQGAIAYKALVEFLERG